MSKPNKITSGELESHNPDYIPIVYDISNFKDDIFKYRPNPHFSSSIDYPKFSLGFHHYIHQTKNKMVIAEQFKGKRKVYYVLNKFERYIDEYESDVHDISNVYFDIDPKP